MVFERTGPKDLVKNYLVVLLLIIILLLGTFLRLYHLDKESLWTDEMVSLVHLKSENYPQLVESIKSQELMPVGYFWLLQQWVNLFGDSEFTLRVLSVIFEVLSIILVYLLATRLFNQKVGIFSSLMYATTILNIVYAQEARPYAIFGFLALLSTLIFVQLSKQNSEQKNNLWRWINYVIITTLALYVNYMAVFIPIIHLLIFIIIYKEKKPAGFDRSKRKLPTKNFLLKHLLAVTFMLLLFIPMIPGLLTQILIRQESLQQNLVLRGVPQFLGNLGIIFYLIPIISLLIIGLGLFLILKKRLVRLSIKQQVIITVICLVSFLTFQIIFVDTLLRSFALIRHSLFLIPILYIFLAKGILKIKSKPILAGIMLIIFSFNLIVTVIYYNETTKPPWKEAVQIIENSSLGTPVILLDRSGSNRELYKYYQHRPATITELTASNNDGTLKELTTSQVIKKLEHYPEFWFISSRNFKGKVNYQEILKKNYHQQLELSKTEMNLIQFGKKNGA